MEYIMKPNDGSYEDCQHQHSCPDEVVALYGIIIPCQKLM
jgi:hypothetical protein